jgi:hypothetical protein
MPNIDVSLSLVSGTSRLRVMAANAQHVVEADDLHHRRRGSTCAAFYRQYRETALPTCL